MDVLRRDNDSLDDFEHLEDVSKDLQHPQDTVNKVKSEAMAQINTAEVPEEMSQVGDLLGDFEYSPPIPPHSFGDFKKITENFLEMETQKPETADRFSDSETEEPEDEDLKMSSKDNDFQFHKTEEVFKDVIEEPVTQTHQEIREIREIPEITKISESPEVPEIPERDYEKEVTPPPSPINPPKTPEPEVVITKEEPKIDLPKAEPKQSVEENVCVLKSKKQEKMGAEAMFCQMGLDAWFNPERLNPKVESLIYWRDPKKSGAVFGGTLVVLLSLAYFSFISVSAYLSLLALAGTISFRIYKNVLQAVQKTSDGHPFKEQLEADLTLPQDKVREITDIAVTHLNAAVTELRRLFLVEDLVDSIKFGVLLWCLTYLGAWFNGMTLIIIAFVALFTLPKVYENNKQQIDANLDIVRTKVAEITSKVKAAIPIGKKSDEKKE